MGKTIFIFACIFSMCVKPPAHVAAGDKSIEIYAGTIKGKSLKVLSIGGFYFKDKVEKLYLDLEHKGILSDSSAQEKLSNYIQGMLYHINKDSSLQVYLIKESFTTSDISISLAYLSSEGESCQVHLYEDDIIFSIYDKINNALIKKKSAPFQN